MNSVSTKQCEDPESIRAFSEILVDFRSREMETERESEQRPTAFRLRTGWAQWEELQLLSCASTELLTSFLTRELREKCQRR